MSNSARKFGALGNWTAFHGFSLLFDNPNTHNLNLTPMTEHLQQIHCQVRTDPDLQLYAKLKTNLDEIVLPALTPDCSFISLSTHSYHVTVWDGLNDGNKFQADADYQSDLTDFLTGLPGRLQNYSQFTALEWATRSRSGLATRMMSMSARKPVMRSF